MPTVQPWVMCFTASSAEVTLARSLGHPIRLWSIKSVSSDGYP
ncbi:unnamed protein product [Pararhodospirillum photometricum DSM 122]|uniref:Uncharacterized protein n=1 Tax=Pararhodospirillum photometricum DSM 122 TaxID=1150469 RepID=H6SS28_PARPM|nr:unnamed protein product [Pararhodospirillum photometricum DSM 122]